MSNKLSFSLPQKSSSSSKPPTKPKPGFTVETTNQETLKPNHEFVIEFDANKTLIHSTKRNIIIPPKENEWKPYKKMKNLDLPSIKSADGQPLQFEVESDEIGKGDDNGESKISYGLNVRQSNSNSKNEGLNKNNVDAIMLKKLKKDMEVLPEDEGFEQFDEVPVEGFGAALLAGYGWHEGRGIGKNAKGDVKVVEYTRRSSKEGLGFNADHDDGKSVKREKEGKKKEESSGFAAGKEVRVIGGREIGLKGSVVGTLKGGEVLILRLSRSEEEVRVRRVDVAEVGSVEEEECVRKLKEMEIRGAGKEDDDGRKRSDRKSRVSLSSERKESRRSREGDGRNGGDEIRIERVHREERRSSSSRVSWLRSHIRVRIISKEFKGGRFYLKKGEVVDVVGPTTCDLSMDDGRELVQGVDQDVLETAVPRRGGRVLVLSGKHKGAYGSLVERNTEKETGVVEDADSRELLNVRLEQIAEYIGDPSDLGY